MSAATAKPVLLILGAGSNVGASLARKFHAHGYSVALAARSLTDGPNVEGYHAVRADLSDPDSVPLIFEKVKAALGVPSVVVYNAAAMTPPSSPTSLFTIPLSALDRDMRINAFSAYVAAGEALTGFRSLPADSTAHRKLFIYTGNTLNVTPLPVPSIVTLGMGKGAAASWVGIANRVYEGEGFGFYYADERQPDGANVGKRIDGDAHADFYYGLATGAVQAPWLATFVKGEGYVDFSTR